MRLITFNYKNQISFGLVEKDHVLDLTPHFKGMATGWLDIYSKGLFDQVEHIAKNAEAEIPLETIQFLPPILKPEKIVCVGVNYANRNEEYHDNSALPPHPSLFLRLPGSFVGHGEPLIRPKASTQFDYEGEIVLVIGREGRHIPENEASGYIGGLTICNEGTLRDWVRHAKFNVTQGKNFDQSGSLGPWIVTLDEAPPLDALELETKVNGEVRQKDSVKNMIFSFDHLIHYISTFTTLKPGDLIVTGTPTGAGARFDPPKYLMPGDEIRVEVLGIGVLVNRVADEV